MGLCIILHHAAVEYCTAMMSQATHTLQYNRHMKSSKPEKTKAEHQLQGFIERCH